MKINNLVLLYLWKPGFMGMSAKPQKSEYVLGQDFIDFS